ncbi:unnamed protein product [Prorocentrum cordatum]|uniref:Uncharacterized protein n=1 Tax=Prorocentrum cordatum TaxID=2364126 RepID=A0ABN9WWD6_9DINO|nr:unnamed protein product [Polarella glacialis]
MTVSPAPYKACVLVMMLKESDVGGANKKALEGLDQRMQHRGIIELESEFQLVAIEKALDSDMRKLNVVMVLSPAHPLIISAMKQLEFLHSYAPAPPGYMERQLSNWIQE